MIKFQSKLKIGWKPRDLGAAERTAGLLVCGLVCLLGGGQAGVWRPKLRTTAVLAWQATLQDTGEEIPGRREVGGDYSVWFCEIVLEIGLNYSEPCALL